MKDFRSRRLLQLAVLVCLLFCSAAPLFSALKNWAVVTSAGSKLQDVPMADLAKLCKGTQKQWPDGKPFTLVIHDPDSADMRYAISTVMKSCFVPSKPSPGPSAWWTSIPSTVR